MPRTSAPLIAPKPASKKTVMAPVMASGPKRPGRPAAAPTVVDVPQPSQPARKPGPAIMRPGAKPPTAAHTVAAPVAPRPAVNAEELAQLKAALTNAEGEIKKLTAAASKARGPRVRTREEILDGIKIQPGDWRKAYHGETIGVFAWDRKHMKDDAAVRLLEGQASYPALLAMPRDADGNWGADARVRGELALHFRTDEEGNFVGEPSYVNEEELGLIWNDELTTEIRSGR